MDLSLSDFNDISIGTPEYDRYVVVVINTETNIVIDFAKYVENVGWTLLSKSMFGEPYNNFYVIKWMYIEDFLTIINSYTIEI